MAHRAQLRKTSVRHDESQAVKIRGSSFVIVVVVVVVRFSNRNYNEWFDKGQENYFYIKLSNRDTCMNLFT